MKEKKQGISLIVLVITIIVIIIIAAAVILGLSKSNPINNGKISQLIQSKDNIRSTITLYLSKVNSTTQGEFNTIQILTGVLGIPDSENTILKQGAEKYKTVYGKNSTPSYNVSTKATYTRRTEVKLENGETKYLYQIDPVAYKERTEVVLDSAMFADAAWYVDPDDIQVYWIFNNQGSYPKWMLENDTITDPSLLSVVGKLAQQDLTNDMAKQEAQMGDNPSSDTEGIEKNYIATRTSEGVPIPIGFNLSQSPTEQTLAQGVVIKDNSSQDEYVWIPVPDISIFRLADWSKWNGGDTFPTPGTWLDITTTEEYQAMYQSVKKYKGFYLARYEASRSASTYPAPTDGSEKPRSLPNKSTWVTRFDSEYTTSDPNEYIKHNGVIKIARAAYPDTEKNNAVVSTLVYGVQWDATMWYLRDVDNPVVGEGTLYIKNSTGMGWYSETGGSKVCGTPIMLGDRILNAPKNIYDLGGNQFEFSMQVCKNENYPFVSRGAYYGWSGKNSATYITNHSYDYTCGFRVALYIR